MTTQEQIAVMQAYTDGKKIQYAGIKSDIWADYEGNGTDWDFSRCNYRVKPEKMYRPYKDCKEMIEDYKQRFNVTQWPEHAMPLIWVRKKGDSIIHLIAGFDTRGYSVICIDRFWHSMNDCLVDYTYLDGSPVGKEEV